MAGDGRGGDSARLRCLLCDDDGCFVKSALPSLTRSLLFYGVNGIILAGKQRNEAQGVIRGKERTNLFVD